MSVCVCVFWCFYWWITEVNFGISGLFHRHWFLNHADAPSLSSQRPRLLYCQSRFNYSPTSRLPLHTILCLAQGCSVFASRSLRRTFQPSRTSGHRSSSFHPTIGKSVKVTVFKHWNIHQQIREDHRLRPDLNEALKRIDVLNRSLWTAGLLPFI